MPVLRASKFYFLYRCPVRFFTTDSVNLGVIIIASGSVGKVNEDAPHRIICLSIKQTNLPKLIAIKDRYYPSRFLA